VAACLLAPAVARGLGGGYRPVDRKQPPPPRDGGPGDAELVRAHWRVGEGEA
jgi:hypothetical protein